MRSCSSSVLVHESGGLGPCGPQVQSADPWGAEMCSCSSAVLMEETAEPIAAANLTSLTPADDVQTGGLIRRLQPERPVRTMTVVVVDIDPKHTLQVPRPTISSQ